MDYYYVIVYRVEKRQTREIYTFLRIMMYIPYITEWEELKENFVTNTELLHYLITKYHKKLSQLAARKTSSKKKYQEKTNNYHNMGIRVAPYIHQLLKDISDATGYSISAIVRFLIEWECFQIVGEEAIVNATDTSSMNYDNANEIVITKVVMQHSFFMELEKVEEDFIWEYG